MRAVSSSRGRGRCFLSAVSCCRRETFSITSSARRRHRPERTADNTKHSGGVCSCPRSQGRDLPFGGEENGASVSDYGRTHFDEAQPIDSGQLRDSGQLVQTKAGNTINYEVRFGGKVVRGEFVNYAAAAEFKAPFLAPAFDRSAAHDAARTPSKDG